MKQRTPLERMAELARRALAVPKVEVDRKAHAYEKGRKKKRSQKP